MARGRSRGSSPVLRRPGGRFGAGVLLGDNGGAGDIYASGTWAAQPAAASARAVPGDAGMKK